MHLACAGFNLFFMSKIKTLLIIGFVWPEPESSAAGTRMMQLISMFLHHEWDVVFASTASASPYMANLERRGIRCVDIALNSETFDTFIAALSPHAVLFDRFMVEEQFGWRVAAKCPDAIRILDTEDLHCLRHARHNAIKVNREFVMTDVFSEPIALREIASILRCDVSIIISEAEIVILKEQFNIDTALLMYIPLFADAPKSPLPEFGSRADFVFIGNFYHEPNIDAVLYLKKVIWPLIRLRVKAQLNIYGAYTPAKISSLQNSREGFVVHGRAPNADDVVSSARVMLAPLRFGAGLKGKLINAMQCGTPSITTNIGAEGIAGVMPWNGTIVNDPQLFADAAVNAYNGLEWKQFQRNGFDIIDSRFQSTGYYELFSERLTKLANELVLHRQRNFTGRMLLHHQMRSSEYMSRWIEAKNKI